MRKQEIAIIALALGLSLLSAVMILAQQVNLEIVFIVYFLGVITVAYLMERNYVKPHYIRYLKYLIASGIVIFGLIVARKVMENLGR